MHATEATEAIDFEMHHRGAERRDFACTLLAAVGVIHDTQLRVATFQVGDGLIACAHDDGRLEPLIDPGDEDEDGAIHVLTSRHLRESMDDRRLRSITFPSFPPAIVITSDGIQRDLIPLRQGGPARQ